ICSFDFDSDPGVLEWFHELIHVGFLHESQQDFGRFLSRMPTVYRINHVKQYQTTYRYIYRNPVEVGLVDKAEDYPFSTLPYVLGQPGLQFLCRDHMNAIFSPSRLLKWLNSQSEEHAII